MTYICSECGELENEYNLLQVDIGRSCPECSDGELIFYGYCTECGDRLELTGDSDTVRCSNCKRGHSFKQLLRTEL